MPSAAQGEGSGQRLTLVIFRPDQTYLPEVSPKTARTGNSRCRNLATSPKAVSIATFSLLMPLFPKIKPCYEISELEPVMHFDSGVLLA